MRLVRRLLLVSWFLCGCSLRLDTDPFRAPLPTKATIQILPEAPETVDDLTVEFVVESTDPLGQGIEYIYEWVQDEQPTTIDDRTVDARRTRRDETWRVKVTPRTIIDKRLGEATEAEVTIADTPAVIQSVGFSTYEPDAKEVLRAFPVVYDPDRDTTPLEYQWFVNGEPIEGDATKSVIEFGSTLGFAPQPDDEIALQVMISGNPDSAYVTEPVTILPSVWRWRQLIPNRNIGGTLLDGFTVWRFWDPSHRRVLMAPLAGWAGEVWEFALEGDSGRYVRLPDANLETWPNLSQLIESSMIYDPVEQRAIVATISDSASSVDVWVLDLQSRARPTWERLEIGGEVPEYRSVPMVLYDGIRRRLLMIGGIFASTSFSDAWALNLDGTPQWTRLDAALQQPAGAATVIPIPGESRAFLVGGFESLSNSLFPTHGRIYEVDYSEEQVAISFRGEMDPISSLFGAYVPHPVEPTLDRVYMGFGLKTYTLTDDRMWTFDPKADTIDPQVLSVSGTPPTYAEVRPRMSFYEEITNRIVMDGAKPGPNFEALENGFWALRPGATPEDSTWDSLARYGQDLPPSLALAVTWSSFTEMSIWGGSRAPDQVAETGAWSFEFAANRFLPLTLTSNGSVAPEPRVAIMMPSEKPSPVQPTILRTWLFSGLDRWFSNSVPSLPDSTIWRQFKGEWTEQPLGSIPPGQSLPTQRFGHTMFRVPCDEALTGYFGGEILTEAPPFLALSADVGLLECATDFCTHTADVVPDEPKPPPSVLTTAGSDSLTSKVVFFGGSGLGEDVWLLDVCSGGEPSWEPATIIGEPPDQTMGHAMLAASAFGHGQPFLVLAGDASSTELHVWSLSRVGVGSTYEWTRINSIEGPTPGYRFGFLAAVDTIGDRAVVYGGDRRDLPTLGRCADEDPSNDQYCLTSPWSDMWELRIPSGALE